MTLTEKVAEEVRALMGRRKVSGAKIARELGVSDAWISYRLSGRQAFDLNDIEKVAEVLGVDAIELISSAGAVANVRMSDVPRSLTLRYCPLAGRTSPRAVSLPGRHRNPRRAEGPLLQMVSIPAQRREAA